MTGNDDGLEKRVYPRISNLTLTILALLLVKLVLQVYLFRIGFLNVSADEYSRGITAARWALDGTLPTMIRMGDWLPFETYLNGLALMVWDNVIWTPRITVFIFSCFLLVYFVKLVQYLFGRLTVTFLAGLLLVFSPWFVWLSGTPMLDIYYLAPCVAGLYYIVKWISERRDLYLVIAGLLFFFSTGFHSQSWILVNVVNLCLCYFAWRMLMQKDHKGLAKLIGFFILGNLFIIIYLPSDYLATGQWLAMFQRHTQRTMEYYGGYDIGLFHKLVYYPELVVTSAKMIWIFFPIGLYWLRVEPEKLLKLFPVTIGFGILVFYSLFNVLSVPAAAAPGRYSLPFTILFLPYASLGIYVLFEYSGYFTDVRIRRVAVALLMISILALNLMKVLDYEVKSAKAAVSIGRYLKDSMEKDGADPNETVMVELSYWDYLYVQLAARHFDRVRFDRKESNEFTGIPSDILSMGDEDTLNYMKRGDTKLIAVKDDAIKKKLDSLAFTHKIKELDVWAVYSIDLKNNK
ncbi:MAG TPA: hypothetical protein VHC46_05845 [Thermodesulfobacteriota bacterium]|nr:hypothetical protein [Thermodesulfobacteriota bacterium]